jgi:hypothetical protein
MLVRWRKGYTVVKFTGTLECQATFDADGDAVRRLKRRISMNHRQKAGRAKMPDP